jgi:hypothetical protein
LFRKLPDGHYKIMLKEPGERAPRLLLDINLRGGRPEDSAENVPETPAGANEGGAPESGLAPALQDALPTVSDKRVLDAVVPLVGSAGAHDPVPVATPVPAAEEPNSTESAAENAFDSPATVVGGACAAAALAACVGRDWADQVDQALADTGSQTLSKAARLSRRLRRPAARGTCGRLSRRYGDMSGR